MDPETDTDLRETRPVERRAERSLDEVIVGVDAVVVQEEELAEEAAEAHSDLPKPRVVPRVKPRTEAELEGLTAPPRQRYPVKLRRSLGELWRARELMYTFVERDLRVRYKQAALGAFWALLQPLMLMVVFSVVFGRVAKLPHSHNGVNIPYPIFAYACLVPWQLFSGAIGYGTTSIITNSPIIRKIYCPREIFPLAAIMSAGVDFAVSSLILLGMLFVYGYFPMVTWIAVPVLLFGLLLLMIAVTLFVSAITAYFRDTRYGMPMLLQILLFATPVAYGLDALFAEGVIAPGFQRLYLYLNPLAPLMEGFRQTLLYGEWPMWGPVGSAVAVGAVLSVLAYRWYKRIDRTFADVI